MSIPRGRNQIEVGEEALWDQTVNIVVRKLSAEGEVDRTCKNELETF